MAKKIRLEKELEFTGYKVLFFNSLILNVAFLLGEMNYEALSKVVFAIAFIVMVILFSYLAYLKDKMYPRGPRASYPKQLEDLLEEL